MMSAESKMSLLASAREKAVVASPARERLALLFDEGTFTELDAFAKAAGGSAGVVTGYGAVEGTTVFAFAQDKSDANGAVGRVQAAKIKKVYDLAVKTGSPVVGIYDSFGAALTEGNDALAAYGEMLLCGNSLSGVVPQVSVVAGVCAGCAAMLAAGADFVVMSKKAELFLTPAKGEGTADNAAKAGVAHIVEKDADAAIAKARHLVSMMPQNNLSSLPIFDFAASGLEASLTAACESGDIKAADLVKAVFDADSAVELLGGFDDSVYTAMATLGGFTCGVVATEGGALNARSCAKAARLMQVCDAFQIPVVTFVNTCGFQAGESGHNPLRMVREAAKLAHVYAEATTPKIAVVTGKAYGPAYVAMAGKNAGADLVLAWPSAVISALKPETAAAILHGDDVTKNKDMAAVTADYIAGEASPYQASADGTVDDVIDPANTRNLLISALDMLSGKRVTKLPKKHGNLPL
ncbi:carboxyl transferase domain-containing protein [Ligaoa zhengdingensis]|uniref:carboxyl transferase domain-containing protein n=2 Tax=Ligaoa zhengdingensis TaxID=2763658 RepID=UPI0031BA8B81